MALEEMSGVEDVASGRPPPTPPQPIRGADSRPGGTPSASPSVSGTSAGEQCGGTESAGSTAEEGFSASRPWACAVGSLPNLSP